MMDMVRGRAISRNSSPDHAIGHSTIAALLRITQFAPTRRRPPCAAAIKRWLLDDTSRDFASNLPLDLDRRSAPHSGRRFHRARRSALVEPRLRLHGSRAAPAPHLGGGHRHALHPHLQLREHQQRESEGWHTGDGMTYLYNDDLRSSADSFWPTVDPQRLPGTTVIAGSTARQSQLGGSNAVGGASLDGYSAVMMQLSPDGRQLSAKKSWFLFDDELVALGADIRSTAAGKTVETIVENRRVPGERDHSPSDPVGRLG